MVMNVNRLDKLNDDHSSLLNTIDSLDNWNNLLDEKKLVVEND